MKNVLITGASGGLGKEMAIFFANHGWNVIATMICLEEGKALRNLPNIYCYLLDVTSSKNIEVAKSAIINDFKTIDVIINNAGVGYRSFVELSDDDNINSIVNINWLGVIKVSRAFIPVFREQNQGLFINISSIAGLVNLPLGSFYHSTKHAVESFSECLAFEVNDFNIKICTVQFGNAPTGFQKNATKSDHSSIESYNILMNKITKLLKKKSNRNLNFTHVIAQNVFKIAKNPPKNFKRFTIGFDAKFLKTIHYILGYKLFNLLIRKVIFK